MTLKDKSTINRKLGNIEAVDKIKVKFLRVPM